MGRACIISCEWRAATSAEPASEPPLARSPLPPQPIHHMYRVYKKHFRIYSTYHVHNINLKVSTLVVFNRLNLSRHLFKEFRLQQPFISQYTTHVSFCGRLTLADTSQKWWFQPIWKIWVKMGIFPRVTRVNIKDIWVATTQNTNSWFGFWRLEWEQRSHQHSSCEQNKNRTGLCFNSCTRGNLNGSWKIKPAGPSTGAHNLILPLWNVTSW